MFYFAAVKALLIFIFATVWVACDNSETVSRQASSTDSVLTLDQLNALLLQDANNPDLYWKRSDFHFKNGNWREAIFDLDRILEIDSMRDDVYVRKADILMAQKDFGRAKIMLDEAIYKIPNSVPMLLKASEIWFLAGNLTECINWANSALGFDPNNAQGYYLKGMAYRDMKDTVKAVSSFQTAIEQDPRHYESAMQLGRLFELAGHMRAEAYYDLAVSARPRSLDARYALGLFVQGRGKPEKALAQYAAILDIDSAYVPAWYNKGYILLLQYERADSALIYFDKALVISPQYVDARYMRGYCLELLGKENEALLEYREVLRQVPHHELAARGFNRLTA